MRVKDSEGFASTRRDHASEGLYVSGGYGSTTVFMNVRVAPALGDPIVRAKLADAGCSTV